MPRLARSWDGVETPLFLAGLGVVSSNVTADPIFAAGHANDDFVFHHQRRERHRVAGFSAGHFGVPDRMAVSRVYRDQVRIDGGHEQRVAQNGYPPINPSATRTCAGGWRV